MLINCVIPYLQQRNFLSEVVWMQYAAPHVGSSVKRLLTQHFTDRIIYHHFMFSGPPRSSDLTPMDFWRWEYQKSNVHASNPQTVSVSKMPSIVRFNSFLFTWHVLQYYPSLLHTKCHRVSGRTSRKFVKRKNIFYRFSAFYFLFLLFPPRLCLT
ncbi:hypothetical protein AVEN_219006-1 [Araneus ventricosus]|uniref:Uncharacterized protein n=1 Tax=Araneus ventricosus TaxID=182803 RepID=A0A4Y2CC85_ARAVE|nr:hypothetical protein AVEN_219006-1 [Araneus ventricosus]